MAPRLRLEPGQPRHDGREQRRAAPEPPGRSEHGQYVKERERHPRPGDVVEQADHGEEEHDQQGKGGAPESRRVVLRLHGGRLSSSLRIDAGAAAKLVCATMDSERALADRCLRGEKKAWLELLRLYDRKVLRVLFRSGVREELDDLRQEVWARLLARDAAALRDFRAENSGALGLFLAQVARRVAIDHQRAR